MEDEFEDDGFEFPPPPPPLQPNYMEPAIQHRQQPPAVSLVLPPFWTENAAGWFAHAESRFRTKRIFDEWDRFDLTVAALSKESIQSVFQLVTSPSEDEPYTALKEGLLHNHQLTDYQRIEKLHALDNLGSRKPTQLLSEMTELCPQGEQQSKFFAFLFLHRLPSWLRIMLGEDDHQDVRALAVKGDRLQALYGHLQHGTVAAVDSADSAVNAVKGSSRGGKGGFSRGRGRGGSKSQRGGGHSGSGQNADGAAGAAAAAGPSPAALAQDSAGLCYYHWTYGDKATKCRAPCSWQGN
jgi:uncharacterized membrane protein YgcG